MWDEFTTATGVRAEFDAWSFGSDRVPEMATELALLVRDGPKRATAGVHDEYLADGSSLPEKGDYSVILDGDGEAVCIIRTTEVTVKPFGEVDEAFAWDEGEGDRTLAWWADAHRRFFGREGVTVYDSTLMILERFELVWPT
jgi:uncharacterized protein YhfF